MVRRGGKRLHVIVLELKAVFLNLKQFWDQCQNQTMFIATDSSTVVTYINKHGGTHSVEMCALLWRIMSWCYHYIMTTCQAHSKCDDLLIVQGTSDPINRMVTAPSSVQADMSNVVQCSHRPICYSSEAQSSFVRIPRSRPTSMENRCCEYQLVGSHSLHLSSRALFHRVFQKIGQCNGLIILIAPGWPEISQQRSHSIIPLFFITSKPFMCRMSLFEETVIGPQIIHVNPHQQTE